MRKQLLKDSAVYMSGSVIVQAMGFAGLVLLMRYLPVDQYGKYIYIIEFISIFAFFADGGFTQFIIKETSQKPELVKSIYARAQSAQVLISLLMLGVIIVTAYPSNSVKDFILLLLYGFSVVISAYFAPMLAVLISSGRKDLIFYKDVTLSSVKLIFMIVGILTQQPLLYFLLLGFLNCLVLASLYFYTRWKKEFLYFFHNKIQLKHSWEFIRQGLLFTVLMAANVIYSKIDIIMLEKLMGSAEVGYYSGATRFIYPFMFVSTAFMTAVFPALAKHATDRETSAKIQSTGLVVLGTIGIILSSSLYLSAEVIFNLFFGHKYDASIPVFKVLVWFLAIVFIYGTITNNLVAKNKINFLVIMNCIMILLNIGINFFLIPDFGALGAAYTTIICEMLVLISAGAYYLYVKD